MEVESASPGGAASSSSMVISNSEFVLDERTQDMTVQEWWEDYLKQQEERAQAMVDDAVDVFTMAHKSTREEIKNRQHEKKLTRDLKGKAPKKQHFEIRLTVVKSVEESSVGKVFVLQSNMVAGDAGMMRLGRGTGPDFQEPTGASLSFDYSVSHWHGKLTCVHGKIFFTDVGSSNGSRVNSEPLEADTPHPIEDGDLLQLGDLEFKVALLPTPAAE